MAEIPETLIQQALGAIKSCGNREGTRREQSGNKVDLFNYFYIVMVFIFNTYKEVIHGADVKTGGYS